LFFAVSSQLRGPHQLRRLHPPLRALSGIHPSSRSVRQLVGHHDLDAWLTGTAGVDLLRPALNDLLCLWPVSKEVNVPGRGDDDASLIEPVEAISTGSLTRSIYPPKEHQEDDRYNDPYADHDTPPFVYGILPQTPAPSSAWILPILFVRRLDMSFENSLKTFC